MAQNASAAAPAPGDARPDPVTLASVFPSPTREDWLKLVDRTLQGADFDKRLVSRTADGIAIQPLYTAQSASTPIGEARARAPTDRARLDRAWDVRTLVDHPDPERANAHALEDLENGAASVLLRLDPSGQDGVAVASRDDLARGLDGVMLELAPVALDAGHMGPLAAGWLGELAKGAPTAPLAFNLDPLGAFATAGASPGPMPAILSQAADVAGALAQTYPQAALFLASGKVVHEAGGTEAQELGFMAACALTYARALSEAGLPLQTAFAAVTLGLAADAEYFTTIAKLRAARVIFARIAAACGADAAARIEARSSRRMLSRLDPFVNLPRLTAAAFGAAVGGADAIQLDPLTQPLGRPSALARRQARNIQLVLMEESHLGRVADPAGGAWFLETLTDQLARAGWAVFQGIEAQGGALAALMSGFVADAVETAQAKRRADIARRKAGLIGVSEFADLLEAEVELDAADPAPFARQEPSVALPGPADHCPAMTPRRDAEPFERLRARAGALQPRPLVFLATLGSAAEHAARTGFARNLFAAGGLDAEIGEVGDYSPALSSIVVLCGPDALYENQAVEAAKRLKAAGAGQLWLAGRPGAMEQPLREAGVDGFIYAGCDVTAALDRALEDLER